VQLLLFLFNEIHVKLCSEKRSTKAKFAMHRTDEQVAWLIVSSWTSENITLIAGISATDTIIAVGRSPLLTL
jgi:hypothetical protein